MTGQGQTQLFGNRVTNHIGMTNALPLDDLEIEQVPGCMIEVVYGEARRKTGSIDSSRHPVASPEGRRPAGNDVWCYQGTVPGPEIRQMGTPSMANRR